MPFAHKVLFAWDELTFIDTFAGPWKSRDAAGLTDSSVGISISVLSGILEKMGPRGEGKRIRCIFNEKNPVAFGDLEGFLKVAEQRFPRIKTRAFCGPFEDNAKAIAAASMNTFQLVYIDPCGYSGFSPEILKLFGGRSSELIINVMRSFLGRFATGKHRDTEKNLVGLLGEDRARRLLLGDLSIEAIEEEYLSMLKDGLGYHYAGHSPIHDADRNEVKFNLAFATNHPDGMEVLRDSEYRALSDYDKERFNKKQDSRQGDLIEMLGGDLPVLGPYQRRRKEHLEMLEAKILSMLADRPEGMLFEEAAAELQQSLYLRRSEIGKGVAGLGSKGALNTPWKDRNGRVPKIGDRIWLL